MHKNATGREVVRKWFDELECRLEQEAIQAGLLGHPTMVGNAREFVVSRVLKSFLPSEIHIGTGRVIGSDSPPSKQVDIILFDSRFPTLRVDENTGLYPVEGVLAAIEVKSRLDKDKLFDALDNCFSVATIPPAVALEDVKSLLARSQPGDSRLAATEALSWEIRPRTYVFSFSGLARPESLHEAVDAWLKAHGNPGTPNRPFLPSVIVTGGAVGMAWGDPVGSTEEEAVTSDGHTLQSSDYDSIMQFWRSTKRFGWLATHLLHLINNRLVARPGIDIPRRAISGYLSFEEYFSEQIQPSSRLAIARVHSQQEATGADP